MNPNHYILHSTKHHNHKPTSFRMRLATGVGFLLLVMLVAVILVQNISLDWAFRHQVSTIATGNIQTVTDDGLSDLNGTVPNHAESCNGSHCDAGVATSLDAQGSTEGIVLTVRDGVVQWMRYGSLVVFAVTAFLAVFLVWRLSGRLTARLDAISQQASQLDPDHPAGRITLDHPDAETASLAAALNSMLDRIKQSNNLQRSFIRNASHELKTPITTIGTSLEALMTQDRFPEDVKPAIRHAIDANRKSSELITSLLELSHIQTAPDTSIEPVDLTKTIRDIIHMHADQITAQHLTTDLTELATCDTDRMTTIETNPCYFTLAIDNLIRNAITHNTAYGSITCTIHNTKEQAVITIDNTTKPSISQADTNDLLQPFHRGDSTRMANQPGHGLGLSIAKACTDAIHASLTISRPTSDIFRAEIALQH